MTTDQILSGPWRAGLRSAARRVAAVGWLVMAFAPGPSTAAPARVEPPIVLYTDVASGPNTGGESGKGTYLSVFGKHFGTPQGLGSATRVLVGGHEVDNYRYLGRSRGRPDIEQITVQIGSLGRPQPGVPLPVEVVANGARSNPDVTFTVNPGDIYFVSLDGNDATGRPNDITRPYRTVQRAAVNNNASDAPDCPARRGDQSVLAVGVWGLVQPGDTIVMRGGRWQEASRDGFFLRAQNKSGRAPRGVVGTGPITIAGFPGERVLIERPNTLGDGEPGGGISAADNARQRLGCGAWITIANLGIETGLSDGPVNTQAAAANPRGSHWRVVNNELSAAGCSRNTRCRAGGVAGTGIGNVWIGNHVHDIQDRPDCCTMFENHGFYVEGEGSYEIAYNLIENIGGGNGIQTFASVGPAYSIGDVRIHHNLIRNVSKHGINIADGSSGEIEIYSNVVHGSDQAALRLNSGSLRGAKIFNNTFVASDRLGHGPPRAALMNDAQLRPGAIEFRNNIIVPGGRERAYLGGSVGLGDPGITIENNLWFDGRGSIPAIARLQRDPRFVSLTPGSEDFHLLPGSPALGAGVPWSGSLPARDFEFRAPPSSGRSTDLGAYWGTP